MGKRWFGVVACGAIHLTVGSAARAAPIAGDTFETYTAGTQLNAQNGGSGFTGAYVVDATKLTQVTAASQALSYSGGTLTSNGGSIAALLSGLTDSNNLISRPFASQTGTTYFSFLLRGATGSQTNEDFLQIGFSDAATGEPKTSVGIAGTTAGAVPVQFFTRVPNGGASTFSGAGVTFAEETTYLLVGKVSKAGGSSTFNRVDLYVNPTTGTEPGTPSASGAVAAGTGPGSIANLILRTARTDAGDTYYLDNLAIGTTYADVVTVVPEPTALGLVGAAATLALGRRRRYPARA